MELNEYRLNSLEDPTDEMLNAIMEKVGISARENSLRVNKELERRMNLLDKAIDEYVVGLGEKVMSWPETRAHHSASLPDPMGQATTTMTEQLLKYEWTDNSIYINPDNIAKEEFGDWNYSSAVM